MNGFGAVERFWTRACSLSAIAEDNNDATSYYSGSEHMRKISRKCRL